MNDIRDVSEIQRFFKGTNVFITGGTGFLGKLILEKLLRSCPEIKNIYVLCRAKKGRGTDRRLAEQFDDTLYDVVRKMDPEFQSKVVPIVGDCAEIDLDINEKDAKTLINDIDIVFHCAATVRFDEQLRTAVRINVRGTRDLILLARRMKRLKAFVHVSTAYSNCVHRHVEEKFYDPPFDGELLMKLVEISDDDTLDKVTPILMGKYPNTYTYTKAIAENVVKQHSQGLPVCIVRPAIILSTFKEPLPGWSDNVSGPTGAAAATLLGILHTWHGNTSKSAALVPGDYVANASIVAAWDIAQAWKKRQSNGVADHKLENLSEIPVYNYTDCIEHALTWGDHVNGCVKYIKAMPALNSLWIYFLIMNRYKMVDMLYRWLFHLLPAYIFDGLRFFLGKKSSLIKNYSHIHKKIDLVSYFLNREWKFETKNTRYLYAKLNDVDKGLFNFDMDNVSWNEYLENYIAGIRVYILKDPLTTLPHARRKQIIFKIISTNLLLVVIFSLYCMWIL